jgi:hypothetical protein
MVNDYNSGLSLRQVGEKHNVSHMTVKRYVNMLSQMRDLDGVSPSYRGHRHGTIMAKGPQLRKEYEGDPRVTVYTLALRYDCSIAAIQRSLKSAGTEMRQAGGDRKSKHTRGLLGWVNS